MLVPVVGEATGELVTALLGVLGALAFVVVLSLLMPFVLSGLCAAIARPLTSLAPFAGSIATRAMADAPARIGVSASALGCRRGLRRPAGMTASLRGEVTRWAAEAVDDKVYVRGLPATRFDSVAEHLGRYPGVIGVEKGAARQYAPFLVVGSAGESMSAYGPFADDPALLARFESERVMIVSRRLAKDLGYEVGDEVQMRTTGGGAVTFEVAAVSDAYGYWTRPDERIYGVVSDRWMEKDFCQASDRVTEISVRFGPGAMDESGHVGVLRAALRDLHPEAETIRLRRGIDVRDYALADIGRDFVVFDLLLVLMAGLAGLGVLNGMLLSTLERARELGVLRALGAARGQVGGAMLLEALVVGIVGGGLGVSLGAAATPPVVEALERIAGLALEPRSAGALDPGDLRGDGRRRGPRGALSDPQGARRRRVRAVRTKS